MTVANGSRVTPLIRNPLTVNLASPEKSLGLSSYRCMFESMCWGFVDKNLTNDQFLIRFHSLVRDLIKYERDVLPVGSQSIFDILKARGLI